MATLVRSTGPDILMPKLLFHALSGGKEVGISKQCFTVSKHFDAAERGV